MTAAAAAVDAAQGQSAVRKALAADTDAPDPHHFRQTHWPPGQHGSVQLAPRWQSASGPQVLRGKSRKRMKVEVPLGRGRFGRRCCSHATDGDGRCPAFAAAGLRRQLLLLPLLLGGLLPQSEGW